MFYTNKDRVFGVNSEIVEWDIKSANLSLIKEYELLSNDKIEKIEEMDKKERVIYVGKQMRKDKVFSKKLESLFDTVVNDFIEINSLDKGYDIVSIKRDAVYVVNKEIKYSNLGKHITFLPKNNYSAFLFLNQYEFYKGNKFDVKGMSDELLPLHENGMICFINDVFDIASKSNMNKKKIHMYLSDYVKAYKNRELQYDHYREFGKETFKYTLFNNIMDIESIDDDLLQNIDISYNYLNIVLPLIQTVCN